MYYLYQLPDLKSMIMLQRELLKFELISEFRGDACSSLPKLLDIYLIVIFASHLLSKTETEPHAHTVKQLYCGGTVPGANHPCEHQANLE